MKVQEQLIFKTPETGRFYNIELNYIYKLNYIGLNFTELKKFKDFNENNIFQMVLNNFQNNS